jgi:hypothetical protein
MRDNIKNFINKKIKLYINGLRKIKALKIVVITFYISFDGITLKIHIFSNYTPILSKSALANYLTDAYYLYNKFKI